MQNTKNSTITIIGAGLGGSFLALLLAQRGYKVTVYERSKESEIMQSYTTLRSYNLTFYDYGMSVLKKAGVWETLEPTLVKLSGSINQISHNPERYIKEKPYYAAQRATLLKTIIEKAKSYPGVSFHFGKNLIAIERQEKTIILQDVDSKQFSTIHSDVIFGADGANSRVRSTVQFGQASTHIQEYADWTYKQIHLSKENAEKIDLKPDIMYAWTRKKALILAHPNIDESSSALLILPKNNEQGFATLHNEETISKYITQNFPRFKPVLPVVTSELLSNPISTFVTIYTEPWYYKDFLCILGDAAHGFNPFYGQGVSAAFADCMTLMRLLDIYGPDWGTIFPLFQEARKKHTDALATLSKESIKFYLRHKKADYDSIYNKLDVVLYSHFPKLFAPPPYFHLGENPLLAGDYLEKHNKYRKRAKYFGIPIAVGIVTGLVGLYELFSNARSDSQHAEK